MYDISDFIRSRFDFQRPASSPSRIQLEDALSDQQYQNLLTHINGYIETLITEKTKHLNENVISHEMSILIATLIKENIVHHKYDLTAEDIERIAEIVRLKLSAELSAKHRDKPVKLSEGNVAEITRIVKEHTVNLTPLHAEKPIDIDAILLQILSSGKLIDVIDHRIGDRLAVTNKLVQNQDGIIDGLKLEIDNIRATIMAQFQNSDSSYKSLVHKLETDQSELAKALNALRVENTENFNAIRTDFDGKLSALKVGLFSSLDDRVKMILLDILGHKSDGTDNVQNWIESVFVAKKLLEEKLEALDRRFDGRLREELNRSAGELMKEIGERINRETIVLIQRNNEQLGASASGDSSKSKVGDLNEADVQRIVLDVLAVYDADKTGLVDFALESAGGEILSTR